MRSAVERIRHYLSACFPKLRRAAEPFLAYRMKLRLAAGPVSAYRLAKLERAAPSKAAALSNSWVKLRPLGGQRVLLRSHTTDYSVVLDTFVGLYHVPLATLVPQTVFDLGSNIGLTMAHYAVLFPHARIVGVELDADNFALCQENIRPYGNRCVAVCGAVWPTDGKVAYSRRRGNEFGFAVGGAGGPHEQVVVGAVTMNSLFVRSGWNWVDFVKMDIEGAERAVLRDSEEWAAKVGCISVEVHPPYTVEECELDLRSLGFRTARHPRHWSAVVGDRSGAMDLGA